MDKTISSKSTISSFLKTLGFKEHEQMSMHIDKIDEGSFASIIDNFISDDDIPKQSKFNLYDMFMDKGIFFNSELVEYLTNFKYSSSSIIGKGETLMRILLNGRSSKNNDFAVAEKTYEIKFGKSRLRGMNGFDLTDAHIIAEHLDEYFIRECTYMRFDAVPIIGTDPKRWNFKSGKRNKEYLLDEVMSQSSVDHFTAATLFVEAFSKFYTYMTKEDKSNLSISLWKEFDKSGRIIQREGYSMFIHKLCAYALKYYSRMENFDRLILLNEDLDCLCLTKDFIEKSEIKDLGVFLKNNVRIEPQNLSKKAGIQGSVFGISI